MQSGTLVRHLILPLRTSESLRILDAIAEELPSGTPVSLMRQYTPMNGVNLPGLDRRLTAREDARVRDYMLALGLEGYPAKPGIRGQRVYACLYGRGRARGCFHRNGRMRKIEIFRILGVDILD